MCDFKMNLPSDVAFILDRMNKSGFSAHVVGGSVRDSLIGRELGDFDITTNALPHETKEVFKDMRTVDTGIKHGTVTLVLNGVPYEITTYRVDGDYKDNRHPESVTFTSRLEEDLARRDFTVNAMAYSPEDGLSDPFGGRADAALRVIRAVGDPYVRFDEDALRILRALRFASVLGFEIEDATSRAVFDLADRLTSISKERVYTELKKLIMGRDAIRILTSYSSVIALSLSGVMIEKAPELAAFAKADYYTRLASLFYLNSQHPAESAEQALAELKSDKLTRTHTSSVLSCYDRLDFVDRRSVLMHLYECSADITEGALRLGILLGRFSEAEERLYREALASGAAYKISHLDVRGGDLVALGYGGEAIGEALDKLLLAVINGEVKNEKTALLAFIKGE